MNIEFLAPVGQGLIEMDVALFMSCVAAAGVNAFYLPHRLRQGWPVAVARLLRLVGWCILSLRFGLVLFSVGDIAISIPSAIALFFLAVGEISAVANRGVKVQL